jgi:hypothetical protein
MKIMAPSPKMLEYLEPYDPAITSLVLGLRELVFEAAPGATEIVYDAYEAVAMAYTFTETWTAGFCHIAAYPKHVNLGFNQGATLPDPRKQLKGTGKAIRHLTVKTMADLERPEVAHFLALAVEREERPGARKQKLIIKPPAERKRRPSRE